MDSFGAVLHSITSGVFAASAGVTGKLAFDEALITNSCLEVRSIYNSSELLLGWIESIQFLPHFFHHTDVCSTQVGSWYLMSFIAFLNRNTILKLILNSILDHVLISSVISVAGNHKLWSVNSQNDLQILLYINITKSIDTDFKLQ